MTHTAKSMANDLRRLGLASGDLVMVHSSYKAFGQIEDGVQSTIQAVEEAVSPNGLILIPSFNIVNGKERFRKKPMPWDIATTPSTSGWVSEYFRRMPGTLRTDHFSHSVAVRGEMAEQYIREQHSTEGYSSPWDRPGWGRIFGVGSPIFKGYMMGGKVLLAGVTYRACTYIHLAEVIRWNELLAFDSSTTVPWLDLGKIGQHLDATSFASFGMVGDAPCRLFPIKDLVDSVVSLLRAEPARFLLESHLVRLFR